MSVLLDSDSETDSVDFLVDVVAVDVDTIPPVPGASLWHNLPAWNDFLVPFSRARLGWGTAVFLQQLQDTVTEVCISLVLIPIDICLSGNHFSICCRSSEYKLQARGTETIDREFVTSAKQIREF